ncbi:MAG: hypothetical protein ACYS9X_18685 [Planctomycetota bacterium]
MTERILDLAEFEVWLAEFRDQHRAGGPGSGRFARTPRGQIDALSCADFAVIDYTVGPWPLSGSERDARVKVLQGFQTTPSGLFDGGDVAPPDADGPLADPYCRTGYFVAALELFGARPLHPIRAMDELRTPSGIDGFLDGIDRSSPGLGHCRAASVAACFAITGDVGPEWFERFFAHLARDGGVRRKRARAEAAALRGAFGLTAVHERFRAPLSRPADVVKMALGQQRPDGLFDGSGPGWPELAAAFVLDRGLRQSGKRRKKVIAACEKLLRASAGLMLDAGFRETFSDDPHRAAGAVSLLAALSEALPGSIRSRRPLRLFTGRQLFV